MELNPSPEFRSSSQRIGRVAKEGRYLEWWQGEFERMERSKKGRERKENQRKGKGEF